MDDIDILTDSEKQACIDSVDFKFKVKEKLKAKLHDSVNAIKYNWLAGIPAFAVIALFVSIIAMLTICGII